MNHYTEINLTVVLNLSALYFIHFIYKAHKVLYIEIDVTQPEV